jgi:hypothetical protein
METAMGSGRSTAPTVAGSRDGFKVFSATKAAERNAMGDYVNGWLASMRQRAGFEIVQTWVSQSSDSEFHCLTITIHYREGRAAQS